MKQHFNRDGTINTNPIGLQRAPGQNGHHWEKYGYARREDYEAAIEEMLTNPKLILKQFRLNTFKHKSGCHVWTLKAKNGRLSLTNGYPRFGLGFLSPAKTGSARQYIYKTTYPKEKLNNRRIKMRSTCQEYCVNPAHMLPRPGETK